MQKIIKIILKYLLLTAIIAGTLVAIKYSINKTEQNECNKWAQEANQYEDYFLTDWQVDQCKHHGIEVIIPEEPEETKEAYQETTATIYAYNSEVSQTDSDPLIMASGNLVYDGAIACPDFIELRTAIEIDGKIYICEDRMNARYRNDYNFDIWMPNKQDALDWGVQEKLIKIYN